MSNPKQPRYESMKRRPWGLMIIVWLHFLAPIGNVVISSLYSGNTLGRYLYLLFQPYNFHRLLLFVFFPILSGVMIYLCKRWSYIVYIFLMSLPVFFNIYFWYDTRNSQMIFPLILAYLVNILVVGFFMRGSVRKIYFDPRIRWWETQPRFYADIAAEVFLSTQKMAGQVVNISGSGLFFLSNEDLKEGDEIQIQFRDSGREINLDGQVVYIRKDKQHGFGVKFTNYKNSKKALSELLRKLRNSGAIIESRLPGPEDSFVYWLRTNLQRFAVK